MANPEVQPFLHFYPEDTFNSQTNRQSLREAWQGARWLHKMDGSNLTPMIRVGKQDFYVKEPCQLKSGVACIPKRWFIRKGRFHSKADRMERVSGGWNVRADQEFEICEEDLALSLQFFVCSAAGSRLPSPHKIISKWPCFLTFPPRLHIV
jgi:hypothetical protein